MALTITEANAVNDLLDYVYGVYVEPAWTNPTTREDAHQAAQLLANHAFKALAAGLRGDDLHAERLQPGGAS
jgi:hypothetical protein